MTEKYQNLMQLQTVILGTFLKLSESFKCSKYSSGTQLSDGTQHMGLRITLSDPRVILRQSKRIERRIVKDISEIGMIY